MATFAQVNGRPTGNTGSVQVLYIDPATVMVVHGSGAQCIVTTTTTKQWTLEMTATDFIALIGGTVTP